MSRFPAVILIPHGGSKIPEEFSDFPGPDPVDLLLSSDSGANELFGVQNAAAVVDTNISRLYVDLDRSPLSLKPGNDGVMKRESLLSGSIFPDESFPDYIAITALLKRYYFPYYETVKKIRSTGEISMIIECHTRPAFGPQGSSDADKPRPLITVQNMIDNGKEIRTGAGIETADMLLTSLKKVLADEETGETVPSHVSAAPVKGHLSHELSSGLTYLRVNLSRSIFINDEYFSPEFAKIDSIRLARLAEKLEDGFHRFFGKVF